MSSEQIHFQVSSKLFRVNSWMSQMIRHRRQKIQGGPEGAVANYRNWQLMTSGRSQVLATSNFRDWHTRVGEIPWSSVPKTMMDVTASLYCTRWGITSQWRSSCISRDRPRSYFQVLWPDVLRLNVQRATNKSQLPKPKEMCLARTETCILTPGSQTPSLGFIVNTLEEGPQPTYYD